MKHAKNCPPRWDAALLLLASIAAGVGCSRQSNAPVASPAHLPITAPAIAATLPATLPAGTYRVAAETSFGRSDDGRLVYEPIEAGTLVVLLHAGHEWSRVRKPDGQAGLIPTARLEPKVSFDAQESIEAQLAKLPALPVNFPVAGRAGPAAGSLQAPGGSGAPADDALTDKVHRAIDRAVKYLESQRKNDNWENVPAPLPNVSGFDGDRWGELTALATLALQSSGQGNATKSFLWLEDAARLSTPAVALRARILRPYGPNFNTRGKALIKTDAKDLAEALLKPGQARPGANGQLLVAAQLRDLDLRQELVAGVSGLTHAGAELPRQFWVRVEQDSRGAPDGTWVGADAPAAERAGASGAAVASRVLVDEQLDLWQNGVNCQGPDIDEPVSRGIAWLDAHATDAIGNPAAMWAVERAALATGRKYLGVDWNLAATRYLVQTQQADGSWPASPGADPAGRRIPETAYALLLLTHASSPVIINKLDYESAPDPKTGARHFGPAQQRPRDVAHFARWVGQMLEYSAPPRWQWVNFRMSPADFQQAPILYISGSEPLDFTPAQIDRLRNYVARGGLIVGNAECGSPRFSRSFLQLGGRLFPKYGFRPLERDHPLLGEVFKIRRWPSQPVIAAKSNGVRELMLLLLDTDLSSAWEIGPAVRHRDRFELGMNILIYASHSNDWTDRAAVPLTVADVGIVPHRIIRVARLAVGNNPDPEPGGWQRMSALMHNEFATDLALETVAPTAGALTMANPPFQVASLTGTTAFHLSDQARTEIAAFVHAGGTLVIDAAGGNADFAKSAEAELAAMFPPPAGQPVGVLLAPQDVLYRLRAAPIDHFRYRRFVRRMIAGRLNVPRLRGIAVGNRTAVFFSAEDLANGLVGQDTDGVFGYDPDTATAIMRNILLYAAGVR